MDVARPPSARPSPPFPASAMRASITAGVVIEDRDGNIALATPAAQRMLGPYLPTAPGWREAPAGWRLADPDDAPLAPAALAPVRARQERAAVRDQVVGVRSPAGETRWLAIDAEPQLDDAGQLTGLVITLTDRTEVMGLVAELAASHDHLAEVMDASQDGFFTRDFLTGQTLHSARMNAIVGLPAVDTYAASDQWRQRIHPEDRDRLERAYAEVFAGELARFDLTYRVRCEDGSWRWVRSRGKLVLRTSDGAPHRLIGTVTDVQAFKELEHALAASERRLREASTAGAVGLWELDLTTLTAWRTERHAAIFGDPAGPWSLAEFLAAVVPEDRPLAQRAIDVGRRAGDMYLEARIQRRDGRLRWIEVTAELNFDAVGAPRLCGSVRDITDRKGIEGDLERSIRLKLARVTELEQLLQAGNPLAALLTACMHCLSVRDDAGEWHRLDSYVAARTGTRFSHGICPTCVKVHFAEE